MDTTEPNKFKNVMHGIENNHLSQNYLMLQTENA